MPDVGVANTMFIRNLLLVLPFMLIQPVLAQDPGPDTKKGGPVLVQSANIAGQYRVTGINPGGGGRYSGTVRVSRTGQTYSVIWNIGSQTFEGVGIYQDGSLSVAYSGPFIGIVVYRMSGSSARGVWTGENGTQLGTEDWER